MPQFLFDTDHLTLYEHGHAAVRQRHAAEPAGAVAISPVSIQETLRGRLAALARHRSGRLHVEAYGRLVASVRLSNQFPIVPFDDACDREFHQLLASRLRIGSQDLRLAAVAPLVPITPTMRSG
jgi:tRNA(fMet)-specific endonuclease VapC